MILPPPNVTGELHVGHALTVAIQDAIVRRRRMLGDDVLYVPGLDHAGIATQAVVERQLLSDGLGTRHAMGRDEFERHVWRWCDKYRRRIVEQLRSSGASLDWQREYFSLDAPRTRAVDEAFVRLFDAGLIYRADRLVNWCCALQTVISDIEVDFEELDGRRLLSVPNRKEKVEFGVLHDVAYKIDPSSCSSSSSSSSLLNELVVSTTRPETMYADVALAVHPDDQRYASLHSAFVIHPLTGARLPVVVDAELVDMQLGTGVVKVTPAHDVADHACGQRHRLPTRSMFDRDGRANELAGAHAGTDRLALRAIVVDALRANGLYRGAKEHATRVPRCSRSNDIIEQLPLPQWFLFCF